VLSVPEAKVFTNLKAAQEFAGAHCPPSACRMAWSSSASASIRSSCSATSTPVTSRSIRSLIDDLAKNAENQKKRARDRGQGQGDAGIRTIAEACRTRAA
jgi:hypothetical protein